MAFLGEALRLPQKNKNPIMIRRILYILLFIGCAALAAAYAVQRDLQGRFEERRQHQQAVEAARQQVDALDRELEQHKARVEGLDNDPVEIEASVRRVRQLVRPGETMYRIEEDTVTPVETPQDNAAASESRTEHEAQ